MAFCPSCRAEYRAGIEQCATCQVPLVPEEDLPELMSDEQIIAAMSEEELVPVFEGPLQALRPVQEKLLEAGIPAAMRQGEELTTEMGLFIKLELVVRKDDLERVGALVGQEFRQNLEREGLHGLALGLEGGKGDGEAEAEEGAEGQEDLACPACGCADPLVDGECPECGLFLGD